MTGRARRPAGPRPKLPAPSPDPEPREAGLEDVAPAGRPGPVTIAIAAAALAYIAWIAFLVWGE